MYDNLTADDIVEVWSRVYLDNAIEVAAYRDPVRGRPAPLSFSLRLHLDLEMENRRKRPFSQITYGCN